VGSSASLDRSPRKNWVENSGNLPPYVREIARSIERENAVPLSRAISLAIGAVKRWARGGGNVNADTRAKAAKAVAQWTALRAKNAARQVSTAHLRGADTVELAADGTAITRRETGDGLLVLSQVTDSGTVIELARYVRTAAGAARYGVPIGTLIGNRGRWWACTVPGGAARRGRPEAEPVGRPGSRRRAEARAEEDRAVEGAAGRRAAVPAEAGRPGVADEPGQRGPGHRQAAAGPSGRAERDRRRAQAARAGRVRRGDHLDDVG
jgi:hypothetical protein